MKKLAIILLCLFMPLTAQAAQVRTFFAMDTYMSINAPAADEELIDSCEKAIAALEADISVTDKNSAVYALNATGRAEFPDAALELTEFALMMCGETGGALDITLYPIIRAWGFTTGDYEIPEPQKISALLEYTGCGSISVEWNTVTLPEGFMLDLGSVAKGYASDMTAEMLRKGGVDSALIDLGGNIYCLGTKEDGSPWRIALRDPVSDGYLGIVAVSDCAVVSSGCYERYFESGGVRYGHIFDPETGYPADNGLISVTVIGESGAVCDALSTALYVMGPEAAAEYLLTHDGTEAVLVLDDGSLMITDGLKVIFTPLGEYEDAKTEWLK